MISEPLFLKCQLQALLPPLLTLLLSLCPAANIAAQETPRSTFTLAEYNCENLFDCLHDTLKNDHEFLPDGERHWNRGRYWKKVNDIARVITQCGGEGDTWRLPDLVAMIEVENDSTLLTLTRRSLLRGAGYRFVSTNSRDPRGIDVALLYNPLTFRLLHSRSVTVPPLKGQRPTRDLLYVCGVPHFGDTLHIIVAHAPSRGGGEALTEPYRIRVASHINAIVDSLRQTSPRAAIIVTGDFNDYSHNRSLQMLVGNDLTEVSATAVGKHNSRHTPRRQRSGVTGTYKYQGRWDSLDHILLSPSLLPHVARCYILDNPWMLEPDNSGGNKPYRTYMGEIYHGGVSDHLPLVLKLNTDKQ